MNAKNRKNLSEHEIKDLLTARERPTPPADLADRIKREIPEDISVAPGLAGLFCTPGDVAESSANAEETVAESKDIEPVAVPEPA